MSWSEVENKPTQTHEVPPVGNHVAVCVALVNLGRQDEEYQGTKSVKQKVYFCWELCDETNSAGERHLIAQQYTLSLNEKASLAKMLQSWRGKPVAPGEAFDLKKVIGAPALVNITHTDGGYAKLTGVAILPKSAKASKPTRELTVCGIGEDAEIPDWLPWQYGQSVGDIIANSHELRPAKVGAGVNGHADAGGPDDSDDTPF